MRGVDSISWGGMVGGTQDGRSYCELRGMSFVLRLHATCDVHDAPQYNLWGSPCI